MAPLPKRRHSTRRQGKRQASIHESMPVLVTCAGCGKDKRPHTVCPHCGYYSPSVTVPPKNVSTKHSHEDRK